MRFIKFYCKKDWQRYTQESFSDYTYSMLGIFLTDEVNCDPQAYKRWALDPNGSGGSGNIIYSDKANGNILLSYDSCMDVTDEQKEKYKDDPLNAEDVLIIPEPDFINIIENWIKFQNNDCEEIWIKNDKGTFWVEGVK